MQEFTGLEYTKIAVANAFGKDNLTWNERIAWVDEGNATTKNLENLKIKKYYQAVRALKALKEAKAGEPSGYLMGLDASSSGIQIMSTLVGCEVGAANTNLINTGERKSIYKTIAKQMSSICNKEITEEDSKPAIMTSMYNSVAEPEKVFGEGTKELKAFYEVLNNEAPGALEVLEAINTCWDSSALNHTWTLPDGHIAHVPVTKATDKKIEVDELNGATFTQRVYLNTPSTYSASLVPNTVQSVDGYIVREMIRRADTQGFTLIAVHDEFLAHPNHMNKVRRNYIEILAEIAESNLLQDIISELLGTKVIVHKISTKLPQLIRNSEYALS